MCLSHHLRLFYLDKITKTLTECHWWRRFSNVTLAVSPQNPLQVDSSCTSKRCSLCSPPHTHKARTVRKMSPMDVMPTESIQVASDVLLAAKDTDFGGYTGPIAGLITLGALILVLAPPLTTKPTEE